MARETLVLETRQLALRSGRQTRLHPLDLKVRKGETIGLLGINGAGKSTTLALLGGALAPSAGQVLISGLDLHRKPRQARRHLGLLPQQPPLYPELTVAENLEFAARLRGLDPRQARRARQRVIQQLDLQALSKRLCGRLSRGQQQRVGIAQALIHQPVVLLLDEPTAGLDPAQATALRRLIRTIAHDRAVIIATHVLADVQACCTRVLVLDQGRVRLDQTLDQGRRARVHLPGQRIRPEELEALPSVARARALRAGWFDLQLAQPSTQFATQAIERGWRLAALLPGAAALEAWLEQPGGQP